MPGSLREASMPDTTPTGSASESDPAPRALLALDGGGMRGAFTLGVLGVLESRLGQATGREQDFVLLPTTSTSSAAPRPEP